MMKSPPRPREDSQAHGWAAVAHGMARQVLVDGKPLDRCLSGFFRLEKKFGSKDRAFLSEACFAFFRWYGWIRRCLPGGQLPEFPDENFRRAMAAALHLDGAAAHPVLTLWGGRLSSSAPLPDASFAIKARWVEGSLGGGPASWKELVPDWFLAEIPAECPQEELVKILQQRPPIWLRIQRADPAAVIAELHALGLQPETPLPSLPKAVRLKRSKINLYDLPPYREGRLEVQDLASQCIGAACLARPGQRWLDLCAGAGGKTLLLADALDNRGAIVATDKRAWKLLDLKKRARRAGFGNIQPRELKGGKASSNDATFDGVLVDAPCSCTGTWRRNPDGRWTSKPGDIAELVTLQAEILGKAAKQVKPGGVLIYATCSLARAENEEQIEHFLKLHPGFVLEDFPHPASGAATGGLLSILPALADNDAMFVARMKKAPPAK